MTSGRPRLRPSALKELAWWEHAIRFVFGGLVTVGAGLIAERWGPSIGGLFLAFPAILPASLTLVRRHDGRGKAADDARGAVLGAVGLAMFGVSVGTLASRGIAAPIVLASAIGVWTVSSSVLWWLRFGGREPSTKASGAR